jgi:hypothetical protein
MLKPELRLCLPAGCPHRILTLATEGSALEEKNGVVT